MLSFQTCKTMYIDLCKSANLALIPSIGKCLGIPHTIIRWASKGCNDLYRYLCSSAPLKRSHKLEVVWRIRHFYAFVLQCTCGWRFQCLCILSEHSAGTVYALAVSSHSQRRRACTYDIRKKRMQQTCHGGT